VQRRRSGVHDHVGAMMQDAPDRQWAVAPALLPGVAKAWRVEDPGLRKADIGLQGSRAGGGVAGL
jgi:hypothetical protein